MRFDDRLAVVTGAASGIGAACAAFLAERGARVVLADRNLAAAQELAHRLGASAVAIDIGDDASVEAAAADIEARLGPVDILVNSAGVLQRTLPPGELSMKEWDFVMRIDLRGTYLCCAAFGTRMSGRGRGAIVNIASVPERRACQRGIARLHGDPGARPWIFDQHAGSANA
jgi:NAD(P)-dependent dehydrogenase (short-subunit alcohol dehydrogenase family)